MCSIQNIQYSSYIIRYYKWVGTIFFRYVILIDDYSFDKTILGT